MADDLLQIGEFAKRAGTNLRTLRYYEELGLIRPARRSSGRFRYYDIAQLERVNSIKRLQGLGQSLKQIQAVMAPGANEGESKVDLMTTNLDHQIGLAEEHVRSLERELRELRSSREKLDECRCCEVEFGDPTCEGCTSSNPAVYAILRGLVPES